MTSDEQTFLEWFGGIIFTAFGGVILWVWNMITGAIKKVRDDGILTSNELKDYKQHVSDHYIKSAVVDRIHDRIDSMAGDIGDIKTMVVEALSGKRRP